MHFHFRNLTVELYCLCPAVKAALEHTADIQLSCTFCACVRINNSQIKSIQKGQLEDC